MKVTVSFGRTGVVVPCKEGWTVRDLIQQATQRYRKLLEQLIAVYEEQEAQQRGAMSPGNGTRTSSSLTGQSSPEPYDSELACFQPIKGGEIEVNSSALKSSTPLLVRSSSDSALGPPQMEDGRAMGMHIQADMDFTAKGTGNNKSGPLSVNSLTKTVEISGEQGPLGIHVVPYCSSLSGRALGLHIRGVEENSRSKREGIFQDDECIVKINDAELMDKSFSQAQEIFRQAMRSPIVRLEVVPVFNKERFEKTVIGHLFNSESPDASTRTKDPPPLKVKPMVRPVESSSVWQAEFQESSSSPESRSLGSPLPLSLSPTPTPTPRGKSVESPLLKNSLGPSPLQIHNKKGGKRLRIDLKKGPEGLGFTVVTRDSSVHGPGPILVKNILPRGAAVKDGRLQSGDRILEVNGVDITGRSQEELVAMLRSTKQGDSVCLVVARQEDMFLPRELKEEQARLLLSEEGKEQLMFEVPLNDSGSAGLGVSLKGNKSRETGEDLGIFIKSIIHGGAAFKDGRLRVNDQLIAVNGEPLLGKSNHEAMETLRRSMSMEGNLRGMIQLVVLRAVVPPNQEFQEARRILNRSFDSCVGQAGHLGQSDGSTQPPMVMNSIYERCAVSNGGYNHMEEGDDEGFATNPHRQDSLKLQQSLSSGLCSADTSLTDGGQQNHVKSSKSMDLVSGGVELGPTLGLKKSSSLESLQTAMTEAKRNELLPFHRPRPHMVRGRGCNESFRAAIDKSYDGPPEDDDDEGSDQSSGRDTPASGSSRQGAGDNEENKKDKKKKAKGKKKDKLKSKGKEKEKKKSEEVGDELDKKTKKKGFGLLRFGKKKEEKSKTETKMNAQKQTSEILSEEELERMKEERERIEAKHQELRERQVRDRFSPPDVEDDDLDPNYARINNFRERRSPSQPLYGNRSPSPQRPPPPVSHSREPSTEDPLDSLYAKVNKQRSPPPTAADSSMDRIQQLRREYLQARIEGAAPAYEELEARRRGPEYDQHRMPVRNIDPRLTPRYEDTERQYASLPRRAPVEPIEYPVQPWAGHRDPTHYPNPQSGYHLSYPPRDNYPHPVDPRQNDSGFYHPPPQQRGPLRQDVPPSPTIPLRGPRFDTMNRGGYRNSSPDRYAYGEARHSDPRQKSPMTAAV
ncbi:partitioning defective 3 homolog B isoform X3 [Ctenopharyngodon idella]|uniref:partitioning defective 3 homolog B isoform X3 n=1 Tax=Ctenopharyngodon idella TaxID=7959 RepID=UPI00222F2414|nr:partitioning defective 3 homolog B isoform X3 [Ctenopharyngodon idella]